MESTLTVVAEILAKPGKEEQVKVALMKLVEPTRNESGCVQYDLHQCLNEPGRFLFFANWKSESDLTEHLQTPHIQEAVSALEPIMSEPLKISKYRRLA
jgi:quinol monooxygenase YgiN